MNTHARKRILLGVLVLVIFCAVLLTIRSTLSTVSDPKPSALKLTQEDKSESTNDTLTVENNSSATQAVLPTSTITKHSPVISPPQPTYQVTSLSKDVVIHSAYFDSRPRNGHRNVTILFANINRTILDSKWILGCGTDSIRASSYEVYSIFENVLMHNWLGPRPFTYENMLILCYDLPSSNGSEVYAAYKTSLDAKVEMITYSREPLFHPAPRVKPSGGDDFTVVVCSKVHNKKAPWIREFIQYQKTLGVDHVDFSVLDTFIKDGGYDQLVLGDSVVQQAIHDGFVQFRVWPETYDEDDTFIHSEDLRKLSCIYRYLGTYDYVMPLDTDDFFNPMRSNVKLKDVIRNHCRDKTTGSCSFGWIRFYPDCGIDAVGSDGNITTYLKVKKQTTDDNFKSVHSTKAILDTSFHDARCRRCLLPGYRMKAIPRSEAYIAHIRLGLSDAWKKMICH